MLGLKPTSFLTTRTPEPWVETHGEKQKKSCFLRTPYGQFFLGTCVLEIFSKIPKKIQKFWSKIFTIWLFWSKNGRVPEKNFQREIFFEIDFFGLEYVLRHSESILKQTFQKFWSKIFTFGHF